MKTILSLYLARQQRPGRSFGPWAVVGQPGLRLCPQPRRLPPPPHAGPAGTGADRRGSLAPGQWCMPRPPVLGIVLSLMIRTHHAQHPGSPWPSSRFLPWTAPPPGKPLLPWLPHLHQPPPGPLHLPLHPHSPQSHQPLVCHSEALTDLPDAPLVSGIARAQAAVNRKGC